MDLLLHEDLGGGFSPPAAHKIRRLGRKSGEHEVDRTPYKGDRKISFVSYHTRAISMNIVRATAWTLHDAAQKAKGRLCGKNAPAAPPRSADLIQPSVASAAFEAARTRAVVPRAAVVRAAVARVVVVVARARVVRGWR